MAISQKQEKTNSPLFREPKYDAIARGEAAHRDLERFFGRERVEIDPWKSSGNESEMFLPIEDVEEETEKQKRILARRAKLRTYQMRYYYKKRGKPCPSQLK